MDPRQIGEQILRGVGLSADARAEAAAAKKNLDRRLDGLGLSPTVGFPVKVLPDRIHQREELPSPTRDDGPRFAGGAASAVLLDPEGAAPPRVEHLPDTYLSEAIFEPSDLIAAQAVTSLATTAAGGTEVRFNVKGLVHVGSGAIGAYWNRPLGASQNFRWAPLAPNLLIPYDPKQGLFVGTNNAGGITVAGVLTLAFYQLPPLRPRRGDRDRARLDAPSRTPGSGAGDPGRIDPSDSGFHLRSIGDFRAMLGARLAASGSDMTAGAIISNLGGGADVTLGTFSDAGAGTQIYLAGSNLVVGGASVAGQAVLNAPPTNTDAVWVGETAALAIASNAGINAAGQDTWNIPAGGKLFCLANSGTQKLGARYRS